VSFSISQVLFSLAFWPTSSQITDTFFAFLSPKKNITREKGGLSFLVASASLQLRMPEMFFASLVAEDTNPQLNAEAKPRSAHKGDFHKLHTVSGEL